MILAPYKMPSLVPPHYHASSIVRFRRGLVLLFAKAGVSRTLHVQPYRLQCSWPRACRAYPLQTPIIAYLANLASARTDSVGVLVPNTECKLLATDGRFAGDGEMGEIYIRGPQVFHRYWKNEEATWQTKTPDGWLRTGDVAVCRQGKFWIVDRIKVRPLICLRLCCEEWDFANMLEGISQGQRAAGCSHRARGLAKRKLSYRRCSGSRRSNVSCSWTTLPSMEN